MKVELVIFDMDGLMFDTEKMYYDSRFKFVDKYNFSYGLDKHRKLSGMNEESIVNILTKEMKSHDKALALRKDLADYRKKFFKSYEKSLKKEGLDQLLDYLRENKIKTCIASSSNREKIEFLLKKENLEDKFDFIVSGDEIDNSKPNPEIFLKAGKKAKVPIENCLVLEDSYNGYLAAKNSNMQFIIIHDVSFEDKGFKSESELPALVDVIEYIKKANE